MSKVLIAQYLQLLCVASKETDKDLQDEPLPRQARWLLKVLKNKGLHGWPEKERGGAKIERGGKKERGFAHLEERQLSLNSVTQHRLGL